LLSLSGNKTHFQPYPAVAVIWKYSYARIRTWIVHKLLRWFAVRSTSVKRLGFCGPCSVLGFNYPYLTLTDLVTSCSCDWESGESLKDKFAGNFPWDCIRSVWWFTSADLKFEAKWELKLSFLPASLWTLSRPRDVYLICQKFFRRNLPRCILKTRRRRLCWCSQKSWHLWRRSALW